MWCVANCWRHPGWVGYRYLGGIAALIGFEGLKKTKAFNEVSGSVTKEIDKLAEVSSILHQKATAFAPYLTFVLRHEPLLRRLAGDRVQFRWLHAYLDWLKQHSADLTEGK
jgi:hypothetical protein